MASLGVSDLSTRKMTAAQMAVVMNDGGGAMSFCTEQQEQTGTIFTGHHTTPCDICSVRYCTGNTIV